ncbi:MAG: response regulator [Candidatus Omnitrophota bacterium]
MPKKILVVDDEINIVKVLVSRLAAAGYEVVAAYDGMQAVASAHREKPDLIILDIQMPAGSGVNVFDNLARSANTILIPVIFITAFADEETREKVMKMGARDFIAKPFDSGTLLAKVAAILG